MESFHISKFYSIDIELLNENYNVYTTNNPLVFLKFYKYDIAFLYFYKKSFIPALIAYIFRKKVIFTGGIDELSPHIKKSMIKSFFYEFIFVGCYILSTACNLVSKSDFVNVNRVLAKFNLKNFKLSYHPHTLNCNPFFNLELTKKKYFTTISWLGKSNIIRKGVDKAILIFAEIVKLDPSYMFYIIGDFSDGKNYIEELISNLNLRNNIVLTGAINEFDKLEILSESRAYFQLSDYEGFGLAVLEAMLCECIVIHTNKGGLSDTINENGIILREFSNPSKNASYIINSLNCFDNQILTKNKLNIINNFNNKSRKNYLFNLIHSEK